MSLNSSRPLTLSSIRGKLVDNLWVPPICRDIGALTTINYHELSAGIHRPHVEYYCITITTKEALHVQVQPRTQLREANGVWDPHTRMITLADDLAPAHELKTLLHEWAHSVGIPDTTTAHTRDVAAEELIAETTAFVLAARLGLDTTAYSLPYVGHWAHGQLEALRAVTAAISQRVQILWHALDAAAMQHEALAALITV